jgi:trimeric autotransporter adhesin
MSTKTTFKRVALVAVAALGFGVLTSVAPASAAQTGAGTFSQGTASPARVGSAVTVPVTFTLSTAGATLATGETMTVSYKLVSKPATSSVSAISFDFGSAAGASTYTDATDEVVVGSARNGKTSVSFDATFTPDVAGNYQFLVYRASGAASAGVPVAYAAGNASTMISITPTALAPVSATITAIGGATTVGGTASDEGAALSIVLKDANGNVTVPSPYESIDVSYVSAGGNTVTISDSSLNEAEFAGGEALINVSQAAAPAADDAVAVTVKVSGITVATLGSLNLTFKKPASTAAATITSMTIGQASTTTAAAGGYGTVSGGAIAVDPSLTSHSWSLTIAGTADALLARVFAVTVTDTAGAVTGYPGLKYTVPVTIAATKLTADFSIAWAGLTGYAYTVTPEAATASPATTTALVVTPTTDTAYVTKVTSPAATVMAILGGSTTFTAKTTNVYGVAKANVAVAVTVTGRNAKTTTTNLVSDASGLVTYTLADTALSTVTATKDVVRFTPSGGTYGDGTVNYVSASTVATVAVTGGSSLETIAGSTITPISAADNGPDANAKAVVATVKDANGVLLVGVPVTFTVDKGLVKKTATVDYATVYTGADGTATSYVFNWLPGKQTVTATANAKTGTDYFTWGATDATSARVLSATATGDIVSLKVVDRFGNPVKGVTIDLSRTGTGLFGSGKSADSVITDKDGTADVRFIGSGSVVAELAATYAQAYATAGNITTKAATAATAGTTAGTGATLAPAGVAKVTVAIAEGADPVAVSSQAAADAAAEATDAANAATDAANAAAEAADAATAAAQDAADAVAALATSVEAMVSDLKRQITALTNLVIKIQRKVKA